MRRTSYLAGIILLLCSSTISYAYYTTKGQNIVNRKTGETVILRGFGIGCWLLPEGYMWGIRKLDRPRQFEEAIIDLVGKNDASKFWEIYYHNFMTESDVKAMKMWGVNSIRIALLASVLQPRDGQPDKPPYFYSEAGFALLDSLVSWCEKSHMGIIWDMHGAPGAQNAENIADSDGEARLWTEKEKYWPRCFDLWLKIAGRYRDKECIIGYDLLNEPLLRRYPHISELLLRELYVKLTKTIRSIDQEGIIFIEGDDWAQNFEMLEPMDWDSHLVIAFHSYPPTANSRGLERWDILRKKYNIPLWHGETGEQGPPYFYNTQATTFLESQNVGWSWWTHKKFERNTQPWNIPRTPGFNKILEYWNGRGEKPSVDQAKDWLFDQAKKTHSDSCEFLPDLVISLSGLDPDGYMATRDTLPPVIIRQPANTTIQSGDPAFFYVRVKGYPVQYQWQKNGTPIDGAAEFMLKVSHPDRAENNSSYSVKAYNSKGSVKSREARLTILPYAGPVIDKTPKAPVIDGRIDPIWGSVAEERLSHIVLGKNESLEDLSVTFKAVWDVTNLYFLIQIDDDVKSDQGSSDYDRDGVEIYLDMDNSKSRFYGDDEFMFRYNWNTDRVRDEKHRGPTEIKCAQQNTQSGYIAEIAIPWKVLSNLPQPGQYIGFDLHYNDNDGNQRECKLTWHSARDDAHQTPSVFGTIKLGDLKGK
ncbi:cellulase family glycosylhydrolase [candidate division KSB1 bacterium]|nr:cellulase family glycosylhydrolase [candidate division KSB1 bacterium]